MAEATENGYRRKTDTEIGHIHEDINEIKDKLCRITDSLQELVEQRVRMGDLRESTNALWAEYRKLTSADGMLHRIQSFQESCPREEIREYIKQNTEMMREFRKEHTKDIERLQEEKAAKEELQTFKKRQWAVIGVWGLGILGIFIAMVVQIF